MAISSRASTPLSRLLSMRLGYLVAFSVLLLAAGFLFLVLLPLSERIAIGKFSTLSATIQARLDAEFQPPALALKLLTDNWRQTPPAVDDEHDFNRGVEPILRHLPQATSAVAGTSDGEGWMLLRQSDGTWLNRLSNLAERGEQQWFVERNTENNIRRYTEERNYDPRQRQWYRQALGKPSVEWTAPYTFFTTGEPGITAAIHQRLPDGRDLVVGIDLKLRDLSQITMSATIGQRGFATILTDDLRTLALPRPPTDAAEKWIEKLLHDHRELGLTNLEAAIQSWQKHPHEGVFNLTAHGENWFAQVSPYVVGDQRWAVVILAPSSDFSPDWVRISLAIVGGLAILLLISSYLSYRQARRIARPLEELVEASNRIGQLDFSENPVIKRALDSSIQEVRALAVAQEEMRKLLAANQEKIETQAAALQQLAHYDNLTELPNRGYFIERLQQAIRQATRDEEQVAVLFLDLDRFKEVNDTQGHEAGDSVLREVTRRFRGVLRQNELLARIGGDEFAIVASKSNEASARRIASRLGEALTAPIACAETNFQLGVSIGISIYPANARTAEDLLRTADIAMYQAKAQVDGIESHYVVFTGSNPHASS